MASSTVLLSPYRTTPTVGTGDPPHTRVRLYCSPQFLFASFPSAMISAKTAKPSLRFVHRLIYAMILIAESQYRGLCKLYVVQKVLWPKPSVIKARSKRAITGMSSVFQASYGEFPSPIKNISQKIGDAAKYLPNLSKITQSNEAIVDITLRPRGAPYAATPLYTTTMSNSVAPLANTLEGLTSCFSTASASIFPTPHAI